MESGYLKVERSYNLSGEISLSGAKNAVLVTIASLLLTRGKSVLKNVPWVADVFGMCELLQSLGANVMLDKESHSLAIDTSAITGNIVSAFLMKQMRTSVLVMGPLLATYGSAVIEGMPGGDEIGARPIDYHLKNFKKMGICVTQQDTTFFARVDTLTAQRIVLEYPSVGATENILMLATRAPGITKIINAALEPEVLDLIVVLQKMGALITLEAPATICVEGVVRLMPVEHTVMYDRLEAGSFLAVAAALGGDIYIQHAVSKSMDVFLYKLEEMGHAVCVDQKGIRFKATNNPRAVSFKTSPYPGFPTDLQPPMMALQTMAKGTSIIEETVFEKRLSHSVQLQKMGAVIEVIYNKAIVTGVDILHGAHVVASDIRASMSLVVAGLMAEGTTIITGIHHWKRGYDGLENKLAQLGAKITLCEEKNSDHVGLYPAKNYQKVL